MCEEADKFITYLRGENQQNGIQIGKTTSADTNQKTLLNQLNLAFLL